MPARRLTPLPLARALHAAALACLAALAALAGACADSAPSGDASRSSDAEAAPGSGEQSTPEPRIVSLSPGATIMLRDVGALGHLVGRHAWDTVADPSLPVCGDQTGIDYELLIGAEPDVVITEWGSRELPERLESLADERGWELIDYHMLSLADIVQAANDIDRRFGARADGTSADQPRAQTESNQPRAQEGSAHNARAQRAPDPPLGQRFLDAVTRPPETFPGVGTVLLLHQTTPPAALGPGSFHHELLERLQLTPAIEDGAPYMRLDAEDVLDLAPEAIVLIPDTPGGEPARTLTPASGDWPGIESRLGAIADLPIPAVEQRRVAIIEHPLALIPSTALIDIADRLAAIARQWPDYEPPS